MGTFDECECKDKEDGENSLVSSVTQCSILNV
jgi:hypothetical protein